MKTRSDSIESRLTPEQRDALESWLFDEQLSYSAARERLSKDFNAASSLNSLHRFYGRVALRRRMERVSDSRSHADQIRDQLKGVDFDDSTIALISQQAFDLAVSESAKPADLFQLVRAVVTAKKQRLDEAALKLERQKFQFNAVRACQSKLPELQSIVASDVDAETKTERLGRAIFGDDWEEKAA